MSEAFATTRYVTGGCYVTAYVWKGKHAVAGCKHKHRKTTAARRCAARMLRDYRAQSSSDSGVSR